MYHHQQQEQSSSLDTPTRFQQQEEGQEDLIEIDPFYFEMNNAWSEEEEEDDSDRNKLEPAKKRQKACIDDNVNHNVREQEQEGEEKTENKTWEETQRETQETGNSGIELGPGDCIILSSSDSEILERVFQTERNRQQNNQVSKVEGEGREEEDGGGSGSDVSGIDLSGINGAISTSGHNRLPNYSFEAESSVSSFSSFEFPHSSSVYTGRIRSFSNSSSNEEIDIENMYVEFEVASDTPDLNPIDDPRSSSSSSDDTDDNMDGTGLNDSKDMSDEDVFADCDEETSDDSSSQSDHRIINIDSDSELSGRDRFPCHQCGNMTYAISRYCLRCFKTRRNWLPQRPTAHKGKKKAKKGKNLKRTFTGTLKYNQQKQYESTQEASDSDSDSTRKTQSNNNDNNNNHDNSSMSRRTIASPKKSSNKNLNLSSNTQGNNNSSVEVRSPSGASASLVVSNINNTTTVTDSSANNNTNESNDSSITHSQSSSTSQSCYSAVPGSNNLMKIPSTQGSSSSTSSIMMSEREQKLVKESMINSTPSSSNNENLSQTLKSVLNDNPVKVEPVERSRHLSSASSSSKNGSALCNVCHIRPKAAFVHNKIAHLYSCFKCSSHILKQNGKCPICRQKILRVVKIITV